MVWRGKFPGEKTAIWLYRSNESAISPELKQTFISAIIQTGLKEWESLPLQVYRDNLDILKALSKHHTPYVKCLVKLIEAYPDQTEGLLHKLSSTVQNAELLWRSIPVHLVKSEPLWSIAPKHIKFPLMDLDNDTKENEEQLKKWLNEEKSFSDKREFVESLPAHFQKQRPFLSYLPPQTQVELFLGCIPQFAGKSLENVHQNLQGACSVPGCKGGSKSSERIVQE